MSSITEPTNTKATRREARGSQKGGGDVMRLWSDEIDAMRDEARQVVAAGMAAMAETIEALGTPPTDRQARVQQYRDLQALSYNAVPEAEVREIAGVPCRVFRPDGPATAIYLHFHGGGMMMGAPEMNDAGNLERSRRHGMAVVSVDYRLAPEHPFPAGPDDGIAVTRWLLDNGGAEFGSERLLIAGESAGGYMAAAVLLRIRDELGAIDQVAGANLAYGLHDWGRSPSQRGLRAHEGPDMLNPEGIEFFGECYLPGRVRGGAPRPRYLARVRGPARAAPGAVQRRHVRPPARRHAHAGIALGCGQRQRRAVRRPRHAARVSGLPLRHHDRVVHAHERMDRRAVVTWPLEGFFNFTVAGLVWGLIGLTLAVLTRSAAMAIGIGIGFLLVVEGLITIFAPDAGPYLPGGTLSTLAAGGNDQLAWVTDESRSGL